MPQHLGCHHDYSDLFGELERIPSGNLEHFRKNPSDSRCSTVFGSVAASGEQLLMTQRNVDDRDSKLNRCGYELKKTIQQLREEKERSAQLEKTLKMLDNQWVGLG